VAARKGNRKGECSPRHDAPVLLSAYFGTFDRALFVARRAQA